ncbi:hypothetical protein M5689_003941 [Euphorbia peplus]|nr:hypothetical protein M5689_003941 [Euphorbia peplus]
MMLKFKLWITSKGSKRARTGEDCIPHFLVEWGFPNPKTENGIIFFPSLPYGEPAPDSLCFLTLQMGIIILDLRFFSFLHALDICFLKFPRLPQKLQF